MYMQGKFTEEEFNEKRSAFCEKYIPLLQEIEDTKELKDWCKSYSAYTAGEPTEKLSKALYEFGNDAYESGIVIKGYDWILEGAGLSNEEVDDISEEVLKKLSANVILACIAWHFRCDHFSEGYLIHHSVAEGYMLKMLKAYAGCIPYGAEQ